MTTPDDVLSFWLDEVGQEGWYKGGAGLDAEVKARFETAWENAMEGAYSLWLTYPNGTLAYIILTDQLPRNMFRDTAKAFASDRVALAAAKVAIDRRWDFRIDGLPRQFFYMPLMHSECLADQERCVRLMKARMPADCDNFDHAKAHRDVIRLFGRFPTRNEALKRATSALEAAFLANGGYGKALADARLA